MLERFLAALRAVGPLAELLSVIAGLIYSLLAVRQDRRCWLFGGLSSTILAGLAVQARLPMQAVLQVVYVVMAIYGFFHWSRSGSRTGEGAAVQGTSAPIGRWPWPVHLAWVAAIAVGTGLLAPAIAAWTAAAWPRLDTGTMLASLLATWMIARLRLENWLYWIVIDAVSLYLYLQQGLALVASLYAIYLVIALFGWFTWRARWRQQQAAAAR
ncbi:MAG: nicotinamide mononucleotide transporter [Sinobacteraceae bacterium]|nr:nicotinamide mononucleotide transporter [Nevskiaceae bacterium]